VQIHLDLPKHTKAPPGSATAGSKWVEFSVRVTNTSSGPVWFHGYAVNSPFYSLFTRQDGSAPWANRNVGFCGTGAGTHSLTAGSSAVFSVAVPEKFIGQQLRVELPVLDSPRDSKPMTVRSDPAFIR
jgi:hypothetical protein